jgi:SAM-dependent methyltransferase
VVDFADFDRRGYPTVGVVEGYRAWEPRYETTVEDTMDLALLDRISGVSWADVTRAVDLGCGTGRTAAWLRDRGVGRIDGVDVTDAMLDRARTRGAHDTLRLADVRATGLATGAYDLAVCCLVDEHLPELDALYAEARRVLFSGGAFVLVGFHPFFIMAAGMPTHFDDDGGRPLAIETHVHLPGDHLRAARAAGFTAQELHEGLVDDEWLRRKPRWERYRHWPVSFAWVWRGWSRGGPTDF